MNYRKRTSGFATNAIHVPYEHARSRMAVVPPIMTSSMYRQDEPDTIVNYYYGRCGEPTREHLENGLASLERSKYGIAFSSGTAAVAAVVTLLKSGNHLIYPIDIYSGTIQLFWELKNINIECEAVDFSDLENVKKAIKSNTRVVYIESPTNPLLHVTDIEKCCQIAHSFPNVIAVVDNTFLTPYFQRPLELGADIVLYSLTKYMNGHSDVVMGSVLTNDDGIHKRLQFIQRVFGTVPSPFDCYQVKRGLKTLAIRMEQHSKSAHQIAEFLQTHPCVEKVMHPGLPSHPQYQLSLKQCYGHSGMMSFYIKGGLRESKIFLKSLKVVILATSLGGVESLASIPSLMSQSIIPTKTKMKLGITDNLIRLSVGLEDINDLIQDLDQALILSQQEISKL